jgi:hypothetical protein
VEGVLSGHYVDREQITLVQLLAVNGDRVDLIRGIRAADVSAGRMPAPGDLHVNDASVALHAGPLALDSQEARPEVEDQVVPTMLKLRLENFDAEFHGGRRDCGFRDVAFVVAVVHVHMFVHEGIRDKTSLSSRCEIRGR